jgi:uncharacterized membrane protein YbaN (DUF454 family)
MATPPPKRSRKIAADKLWRPALFAAGWIFLAVGLVGLFLPLLPGTVFLILSAACFTRSSPRFERWLLTHPRLGPPIRRWRETGAIPGSAKAFAVASLCVSWAILFLTDAPNLVKIGCLPVFCGVAAFIVTRPKG